MKLDPAIIALLDLDPDTTSISSASGGGMSSASTSKITTKLADGTYKHFFMKTGRGSSAETMFRGEHASLSAIHNTVPTLCPKSHGHGTFKDNASTHFLVTDWLHLTARGTSKRNSGLSLAQKLAQLHTTPAPVPPGHHTAQFGFPVPTCCGDTPQDNTFTSSWPDFYANHRLRFVTRHAEQIHGKDASLSHLVEQTCDLVIPRLLSDEHLNGGAGVVPVLVHGDLWSGNAAAGTLPGMSAPEDLVFDSSACYAHSEYELGIMRMFGGFGAAFLNEYHGLVPKTEPVEEYEDRVRLYELYHHLNHYALFGGGYKSGAAGIMRDLLAKYGEGGEGGG